MGKLTDGDIEVVKGKRTEPLGLLQKRYGHAKEKPSTNPSCGPSS